MPLFGSGHEIVTSTTRPSVPIEGQIIYETNTKCLLVFNGSNWIITDNLSLNYTPMFWVTKSTGITSPQTVIFDAVKENVGSHYSTVTGLFTAPINGVYQFSASCITQTTGSAWKFLKNGTIISGPTPYHTATSGVWIPMSASVHTTLTVGQTFGVSNTGGQFYGDGGNVHNHFSGSLISYR